MRKVAIVLFLVLVSVSTGRAQSITGNLAGRIVNQEGNPLDNVNILVSGKTLLGIRGTTTDEMGIFYLSGLPSGQYDVLVDHASFQSKTISKIRISLGTTVNLGNIPLELISTDNIEVLATDHDNIDLTSTAYAQNLHFDDLDELPLDRNYQAINKLMPQANESFFGDGISVAGATGLENKYFINGLDVTDPKRGGSATILPYNFVQDIQILTGGYEAEYRGSLGGLINVVTYSGGDEFSGKMFGFFTNNRFSGNPRPGATPLPESYIQYDFGGSIGGPILKDKLWFFAAYNPTMITEKVNVTGMGEYDDWRTAHIFAGKLTWKVNGNNTLQFNVFGDPVEGEIVDSDLGGATVSYDLVNDEIFLYKIAHGSINATVNGTHILGNHTLLESSISWARFRDVRLGDSTSGVFFKDDVNKFITGSTLYGWEDENIQRTLGLKVTHSAGDHILKTGIDFASLSYKCDYWTRRLDRSADTIYVGTLQRRYGTTGQYILGLFLQDTWSVTQNLKINAGLRWDPQFLEAADKRIAQKFMKNISPRLGVIFLPETSGLEKLTASYGRFYQMLSTYVQQWYQLEHSTASWIQWNHDPRVDPGGGFPIYEMDQAIQNEFPEMQGQHYDEFTLGYERLLPFSLSLNLRGIYRNLRQGIEDGVDLDTDSIAYFGNPGSTPLKSFPKMLREYAALEITLKRIGSGPFQFFLTYVLSRTYGNTPGIFNYLYMDARPNSTSQFDTPDIVDNGTGLLVNDRTHAFKFMGSYHTRFGLTIGSTFIWMSGTPLSEYGGHWIGYPMSFVTQRGTAGRTPAIWDLSMRAAYELEKVIPGNLLARLILDVFHAGSPQRAVDYDQTHYFAVDDNGNQINPNPEYLQPIQFQPPMSVRVGMEVEF